MGSAHVRSCWHASWCGTGLSVPMSVCNWLYPYSGIRRQSRTEIDVAHVWLRVINLVVLKDIDDFFSKQWILNADNMLYLPPNIILPLAWRNWCCFHFLPRAISKPSQMVCLVLCLKNKDLYRIDLLWGYFIGTECHRHALIQTKLLKCRYHLASPQNNN